MFVLRNLYILLLILVGMKKFGVLFILSLLLISGFVSAQSSVSFNSDVEGFLNDVSAALSPIAKYFLGSVNDGVLTTEDLFVKFLVFLLVFIFTAAAAKRIPLLEDKPTSAFIVAAIVSIAGVRFITTQEIIATLWLPSSTFAVALSSILPFILFFFLIEGFDSSILRKFGWTTYFVIFGYFTIFRWRDLKFGNQDYWSAAWIYLIISLLSGLLILYDRQFHSMSRRMGISKISDRNKRIQAVGLAAEIDELYVRLTQARTSADRSAIESEIRNKETNLKSLY